MWLLLTQGGEGGERTLVNMALVEKVNDRMTHHGDHSVLTFRKDKQIEVKETVDDIITMLQAGGNPGLKAE